MIDKVQSALRAQKLDGWLFFDHHRRDPIAYRILQIPSQIEATRRWYYFVPAHGVPKKLVHRIESTALDSVPGEKVLYARWTEQTSGLARMLNGIKRIAMQYSPRCAIPYVSLVDGGTIELVRELGIEIVSSADLVQEFEATLTAEQLDAHIRAGVLVDQIRREAFQFAGAKIQGGHSPGEFQVQQFILCRFRELGLVCDHGPIVAVNQNASDPHYEPTKERSAPIRPGDLLLIDLWAKLQRPDAVYYDVTWVGYCGHTVPDRIRSVFSIVRDARKTACEFVRTHTRQRHRFSGWQVDDAARELIDRAGFGEFFFHRTGHSIGTEVHGTGANMDNFESHDDRRILPNTCFSIEPGIYLPEFGIRSEVNVFVSDTEARVTGEEQQDIVLI